METRPSFYFLNVDAHLPNEWSPEIQRRYTERATAVARDVNQPGALSAVVLYDTYHTVPWGEENLIRNGLLQECLLQTEPFQSTQENMIHDLHNQALQRQRFCPDRGKLLFLVAHTLLQYERSLTIKLERMIKIYNERVEALTPLKNIAQELERLYQNKGSSKNRTTNRLYQNASNLVEAYRLELLSQAGQIEPQERRSIVSDLHLGMHEAFRLYGPRDASVIETRLAIAAILSELLSEHGASLANIKKGHNLYAIAEQHRGVLRRSRQK
jgi:hypothetical protein